MFQGGGRVAKAVGESWQAEYPETSTPDYPVTWQTMEAAGAVCLPAAGDRSEKNVKDVGVNGFYWSSSELHQSENGELAFGVGFSNNSVFISNAVLYE